MVTLFTLNKSFNFGLYSLKNGQKLIKGMNMNKQKNTLLKLMAPAFAGVLLLSACSSQQQKDISKGSSAGNATKSGAAKDGKGGAKSGKVGAGGASNARNTGNNKGGFGGNGGGANGQSNYDFRSGGKGGSGRADDSDITPAGLNDPNNLLSQRIIYFDYNKSSIRPEYMVILNTHAKLISKYPNLKARLEGHADERGSREYNVALSEDRARSVKRLMGAKGAPGSQMTILGYGEELPVVTGHNKKSWEKNRRVEIKYKNY